MKRISNIRDVYREKDSMAERSFGLILYEPDLGACR